MKATYYDLVEGKTGLYWEDAADISGHAGYTLKRKHEENRRKTEGALPGELKPGDKVRIVAGYGYASSSSNSGYFTGPFDLDLKKLGDVLYSPETIGYHKYGDGYDLIGPVLCGDGTIYGQTGPCRRPLEQDKWLDLCTSAFGHIAQVDGRCALCGQKIPWFCLPRAVVFTAI